MNIIETKENDAIKLEVEGQVDTVTAPELQQTILTSFQKSGNVILDIEKVAYMSSAGLRALLLGQKTAKSKGGSLKVRNVHPTVMQVFEMSGFASILDIE